jgi:hypothetical protein
MLGNEFPKFTVNPVFGSTISTIYPESTITEFFPFNEEFLWHKD